MAQRYKRRQPSKCANPLQSGILDFMSSLEPGHCAKYPDHSDIPKRYTRYGSLLLLGPTFEKHTATWATFWGSLQEADRRQLMQIIVTHFDQSLTHIAVNAPISLTTASLGRSDNAVQDTQENIIRSPSGLVPLYGDFGPDALLAADDMQPGERDFARAYWTATTQVRNIYQVWAPRWTMFSRGNISEKARIVQDGKESNVFPGLSRDELDEDPDFIDVVDFYVGIGYFAFCYLARGVRRVWGFELNGWSVEGLRRGCVKNGWGVRVIRILETGEWETDISAACLVQEIMQLERTPQSIRCIVFQGDNRWACKVMSEVSRECAKHGQAQAVNVRHCNLGLLPTSESSWEAALRVLNNERSGWVHVHENADINGLEDKKRSIISSMHAITTKSPLQPRPMSCDHVERVKTYAPGVMHCVFDIKVDPS